jgi:hypothetical protein
MPMNVAIRSLVVIYLKLAKLDQVNSRFSILWVVFNIPTISNRGSCISCRNLALESNIKHYYAATAYEIQSSRRFNSGRNWSFPMFIF